MIEYRSFRNYDPPHLLRLILDAKLGRGGSRPESYHSLDIASSGLSYFDPAGLIVAKDGNQYVGFVHAGFAFDESENGLDKSRGVICLVIVSPSHRRQGIGRELMARAEVYLRERGAKSIQAGQSRMCDPFYFGIYGGARNSGFLKSDESAEPFLQAVGYEPGETFTVLQRGIEGTSTMNFRYQQLKRKSEIIIADQPEHLTRRWLSHFGNIESMSFELIDRQLRRPIASLTVVGLDNYILRWHQRAIGLVDLHVEERQRGQGYSQVLICETLRKLRTDMISLAEVHVPDENAPALAAVRSSGFEQVDTGVVYQKMG